MRRMSGGRNQQTNFRHEKASNGATEFDSFRFLDFGVFTINISALLHSDRKSVRIEFTPLTFECLALSIYELCPSRNIINTAS